MLVFKTQKFTHTLSIIHYVLTMGQAMFCVLETLWRILPSLEQEGCIRNKYTCYNVVAMKEEKQGNDRGSRQLKVSGGHHLIKTAQERQLPGC